ncbi:pyruvate kinase [Bradyrhizobium sp. U87765 SZCCT0131]|uniref:pyruvate kinase n=1 Tax=unclassified Bradyrhizobium TaxID=2631580 RepID=UPI001BA4E7FB|nr:MULTISPECIES: pyruvate kinase [unclassified Bradyrhizobium]MBR1219501.1 pyruvate kinase [Bradyrhizobium sp. U87765 SZCCT0131]MBR1262152.1 pyruvate kinase [Bradyrhizobium sp. U87765 SZCCT0134]MBR1308665.1 pyruvate kinase [Bradyrhizobium sp. U87765 SZCCT0110]MBR1317934.1 pyruvate kinase [Bradyrhizobium sp. U87765 SZCCT0109]MBR1351637.1 pyruvate kinase [Bradyrhizobium sp. U87765 SZCCT0048]
MRRSRNAKIIATLGPSSSSPEMIRALFETGVDMFRLNFSHGSHDDHRERFRIIREVEREVGRPVGILMDLQGPKLRVGKFANGPVELVRDARFRLDLDPVAGDASRVALPHPEIFAALAAGTPLLLDDGKIRLSVESCGPDFAETRVVVGGRLSEHKGINVPSVILPMSPFTARDRRDLAFGLDMGADWVALSFVQRPEDIDEARALIGDRALVMAKMEKPAAIHNLDAIVARADGIMVARGDLGVEMPPEQVPVMQRRIVRACHREGKPVVVATQMLESMTSAPVPTRAEASDVATAVYEGADAVMLSAESASGQYPREAVAMMESIIRGVEADPHYRTLADAQHEEARTTHADAICRALRHVARQISAKATVTYTSSGFTSIRAARERPVAPILSITPSVATARRLAPVWGVHSVVIAHEIESEAAMTQVACETALAERFAAPGDSIVVTAGIPFGVAGTTNLLRIVALPQPAV